MRLILTVASLLWVATGTAALCATPGQRVDQYLTRSAQLGRFNGVALVAVDGKVVLRKGYGYADFSKRIRNTAETQFEIASISKMFTADVVLQLARQGKLSLSDSVCRYLSPCPALWNAVTIDELIHHRSGIPDYETALGMEQPQYFAYMTKPGNAAQILADAAKKPLDFTPGSKYSYSNTGYIALANVAQQAAGEPFAQLMHHLILDRAGLAHSGVLGCDKASALALPYAKELTWAQRLAGVDLSAQTPVAVPQLALEPVHGDAEIFSTVDDLYRWSTLAQGSSIVPAADAALIFTPVEGYGFGWTIDEAFGTTRYRHTGELPGYLSDLTVFPKKHVTIVLMQNFESPMGNLVRDVSAAALDRPFDLPYSGNVVDLDATRRDNALGTYRMTSGETLTIAAGTPYIVASIKDQFSAGLIPLDDGRFYMPLSGGVVTFGDIRHGRAQRVTLHYAGVDHNGVRTP